MKAFITGISGFVGAGLARRLVADGVEVHGLVRPTSDLWRLQGMEERVHLHQGDLRDTSSVRTALRASRPDTLFHLGVHGAYPTQKDRDTIIATSFLATIGLLDAAKENGVRIVINTGSSSEYGTKNHPMKEDDLIQPNSYYAVGKAAQTLYCQQFARQEKLPVITLRLFSVYGPYEDPARFIPTLTAHLLANKDMPLANPAIARDFIYIDDVADAYWAAAQRPEFSGEIFNVGTGIQRTIQEAFDTAVALTGSCSKPLIGAYENRNFDTDIWVADMRKSHFKLGLSPKYSLKDGLRATVEWAKTCV